MAASNLVALCLALAAAYAGGLVFVGEDDAFLEFMTEHARAYMRGTKTYIERRALFQRRLAQVHAQNRRPGRSWTAAINGFSDWTDGELRQLRGWRGTARFPSAVRPPVALPQTELPTQVDWRNLTTAAVAHNQGGCGSCWAVACAEVLDMHVEIYGDQGAPIFFSSQELVDCVPNPHNCGGTGGCEGGTMELAFGYMLKYGLSTASAYPYTGASQPCAFARDPGELLSPEGDDSVGVWYAQEGDAGPSIGITAWERLPMNDYEELMTAVATRGPVVVAVAADDWALYSSGIFDSCPDTEAVVDHAVALIGYGPGYWLLRNSWGTNWGEQGNIRLLRSANEGELCAQDHQPEMGVGCDGGPAVVEVCGACGILYDAVLPHMGPKTRPL